MVAQMSSTSPENPALPTKAQPRSTLVSRNVTISGHRTSVRLEPEMWSGLKEICRRERATLHEICTIVASRKEEKTSLTAAIRVFVMAYYRAAATEEGHVKAGHGYGAPGIARVPTHNAPLTGSGSMSAAPRYTPNNGYMSGNGRSEVR